MEFADDKLEAANLKRIYDTYRHRHGIPTAEDLKRMRERYGIPSTAMSIILGLGENQFGLYEEGTVPTLSVGRLLALAMNPANMMDMLRSSRNSFSDKQYAKYFSAIATSRHPAKYETEDVGLTDYCLCPLFPSANILLKHGSSPNRRISYYESGNHVPAC